ncbi:MAG: cohesin domain-containing protein [Saprospiraceae bacterium]
MGCGSVQAGQTICIPVTITAVDSLVAAEFTIGFNQLAFDFVSISNLHPEFDQPLTVNPVQSQGRIKVLWLSSQVLSGTNFNAGDVLFEICLKAKAPGSYPINFIGSGENLFLAYGSNGEAIIPSISGCSIQVTPASTLDAFFQACYNMTQMQGTVTIIGYGGTSPYNVSWSGPQNGNNSISNSGDTLRITGLPQGTYTFHIVDVSGADSIKVIELPNPSSGQDLEARLNGHDPTCFGDTNGSMNLSIFGGTGPQFFVQWNTGEINTRNIDGLAAGTYSVTVTDINGCTATHSSTIGKDPIQAILLPSKPATCLGLADGSLQVAGTGGNSTNGFYDFEWIIGPQVPFNPRGSVTVNNAEPGVYRLRISDGICADTFDFNVDAQN